MIGLAIVALSVVLPLLHLALSKAPRTKARIVKILLLYALVIDVGFMGFFFGFIPHVFFPDQATKMIGWSPSPFQFEVGFHDGAWGSWDFYASGSAVSSGSPPASAGRCSCSVPQADTSIRLLPPTTTLPKTS